MCRQARQGKSLQILQNFSTVWTCSFAFSPLSSTLLGSTRTSARCCGKPRTDSLMSLTSQSCFLPFIGFVQPPSVPRTTCLACSVSALRHVCQLSAIAQTEVVLAAVFLLQTNTHSHTQVTSGAYRCSASHHLTVLRYNLVCLSVSQRLPCSLGYCSLLEHVSQRRVKSVGLTICHANFVCSSVFRDFDLVSGTVSNNFKDESSQSWSGGDVSS